MSPERALIGLTARVPGTGATMGYVGTIVDEKGNDLRVAWNDGSTTWIRKAAVEIYVKGAGPK